MSLTKQNGFQITPLPDVTEHELDVIASGGQFVDPGFCVWCENADCPGDCVERREMYEEAGVRQ